MAPRRAAIAVGLGEAAASRDPRDELAALGSGSCVGVCGYDPVARVGGLLHAMLSEQNGSRDGRPAKYADSGIRHLLDEMSSQRVPRPRIVVVPVGGAQVLVAPGFAKAPDIGARSVATAEAVLAQQWLQILAADVVGSTGRTVRLCVGSGRATVRWTGASRREMSLRARRLSRGTATRRIAEDQWIRARYWL